MTPGPHELATRARILRAALDSYVSAGAAVPTVRAIATSAGVSTGSIQHFFPSQAALRSAVNDYVIGLAAEAFGRTVAGDSAPAVGTELGRRLTEFFRDHPTECRYLARTLIDGDETAGGIFAALLGLSDAQWARLHSEGLLRDDVDLGWAALHVVIANIGTFLLRELIEEHLPGPLTDPAGLHRWQRAQTALFQGLYQHPATSERTSDRS